MNGKPETKKKHKMMPSLREAQVKATAASSVCNEIYFQIGTNTGKSSL